MNITKLKYYLFVGLASLFSVLAAQQFSAVNTPSNNPIPVGFTTTLFLESSKPISATPFSELEFIISAEDLNENENENENDFSDSFALTFSSLQVSSFKEVLYYLHYPQQANNSTFDVPLYVKNCVYLI